MRNHEMDSQGGHQIRPRRSCTEPELKRNWPPAKTRFHNLRSTALQLQLFWSCFETRILINLRGSMRVQFMAAVILGLTLSPAPVFGCTCAAPPPEVKTASELAAWTRADAIFEGKVESVELRWKLKEAQIGDVIPTVATDLDSSHL